MRIAELLKFSLVDYPGKIAAVAFVPACNFSCPACHARPLLGRGAAVSEDEFLEYLKDSRRWVGGAVLCGGEPTLEPDLLPFARRLAAAGVPLKLDTNGSRPEVLEKLLEEKLVSYVALDVKGPPELLDAVTGTPATAEAMARSIRAAARFPDHEYRTTAVPVLRGGGEISFLTAAELGGTARAIAEAAGPGAHKYFIQKFVPRKDGLLDKRLESFPQTPAGLLEEMRTVASKYLPKCEIR